MRKHEKAIEEKLEESQSQEIGDTYRRLSKLYGVDMEELVYGEDGFMKTRYPQGFPDFAGDVIYSEKYWNEFEDWLKNAKGIILTNGNGAGDLDEELKVIIDFGDYKPWSGAISTYEQIRDANKLDELEAYLEDCYPEGITATQLNDILWFDSDAILRDLGLAKGDEEDVDESLKEHVNEEHTAIESDHVLQGVDNAVVDCKTDHKIIAHSEDEKPLDCKMEKPALEEPLASEEVNIKINEDIDLTDAEIKELEEDLKSIQKELTEAKKDDELPVDPEAAKLEVHTMLNDLVADEIEAINGYEEAKKEILDTPIAHKDNILDTIDHVEDEEKEHVDELIDATTEIPFDKEEASAPAVEEPVEEPVVEEEPFNQEFPEVEENLLKRSMQDVAFDSEVKVGDKIKINHLNGEDSSYDGKEGTVEHIDGIGQLHGTWGGLAVIPGVDEFEKVTNENLKESASKSTQLNESSLTFRSATWNSPNDKQEKIYAEARWNKGAPYSVTAITMRNSTQAGSKLFDRKYATKNQAMAAFNKLMTRLVKEYGDPIDDFTWKPDSDDYGTPAENTEEHADRVDSAKINEASSAEKRAYKNGGEDLDDLLIGKAVASLKNKSVRKAVGNALHDGDPEKVAELKKLLLNDPKFDDAEARYVKKAGAMERAGLIAEAKDETIDGIVVYAPYKANKDGDFWLCTTEDGLDANDRFCQDYSKAHKFASAAEAKKFCEDHGIEDFELLKIIHKNASITECTNMAAESDGKSLKEGAEEPDVFTPEEQEEYGCDEDGESIEGIDTFHHCGWCKEVFPETELRHEADFGWLCDRCIDALKSHGGPLTFIENESLNKDDSQKPVQE